MMHTLARDQASVRTRNETKVTERESRDSSNRLSRVSKPTSDFRFWCEPRLYVCQTPGALIRVSTCGSILGHFGSTMGPFWVHVGSILGPSGNMLINV